MKQRMLSLLLVLAMIPLPCFALAEGHSVTKLDDDGYLYFMDYTKDYYGPHVIESMREAAIIDPGCSTFITHNPEGEPLSCRNYDYPHRISKEDQTLTGLNIVLHCKPEDKYELVILRSVVQNEYTESTGTSMTQYSAIYNNARKTVKVWPFQNYESYYEFDVTGTIYHLD